MPKVLCVCYGGGHARMLLPVILRLIELNWKVNVLALTTAYSYLSSNGIKVLGFKDFIDPIEDEYALKIGRQLSNKVNNPNISLDESIAYLGISYAELEAQLGKEEASKAYTKSGRQAFFPLTFMKRICKQIAPDIIISTNSPRAEKASIYAAKELGIPSIVLIDLFLPEDSLLWFADKNFGNRVCVISNRDKERLVAAGRSEKEIIITGNPAFDNLIKGKENFAPSPYLKEKKKILWASTPEPGYFPAYDIYSDPTLHIKIEDMLVDLTQKHPDWHLIIRHHPNEPSCKRTLTPQISISHPEDNLKEIILSSDLVITTFSTVALEAHILQKAVLCLELSPWSKLFPFSQYGIAYGISDWERIEETLDRLLKNPTPLPLAVPNIGQATESIVKVIHDLAAKA